jgi:hypothetical protein
VFQVDGARAAKCQTAGVPSAASGDLLWTCGFWLRGDQATNAGITSFAALDGLLRELVRQWPGLRTITVSGFSAGAQVVQHYIGFAASAPAGVTLRYVVADPGSWLHFDAVRAQPQRHEKPVVAYATCDRALLAPAKQRRMTIRAGCAHNVACVFPSAEARAALIAPAR